MDYTGITCVPVLHKPAFYFMGALRVFLCPCFPAVCYRRSRYGSSPRWLGLEQLHTCVLGAGRWADIRWQICASRHLQWWDTLAALHKERRHAAYGPCMWRSDVSNVRRLFYFFKCFNSQARRVGVRRLGRASRLSANEWRSKES